MDDNIGLARQTTISLKLNTVEPWSHFAGPWGVYNLPITPSSKSDFSFLSHICFTFMYRVSDSAIYYND